MTTPKPNAELAYATLDYIDAHPARWDQGEWCGTSQCFAGWTVALSGEHPVDVLAGMMPGNVHVADRAAQLLGFQGLGDLNMFARDRVADRVGRDRYGWPLDDHELFAGGNTREDLGRLVAEIFGERPTESLIVDFAEGTVGDAVAVAEDYDDVPPNAGSAS